MNLQQPNEIISCENYVNGQWVSSSKDSTMDVTSPYFGTKIGELHTNLDWIQKKGLDR